MESTVYRSDMLVILSIILISITSIGCLDGDDDKGSNDTTGALPPGSPPGWEVGFGGLMNETIMSADSLMAHADNAGLECVKKVLSFTNKAGVEVTSEYAGYGVFDLLDSMGLERGAGEVCFTASDNYSITVNIADLYLEGENGRAMLVLARDGEWLERPMLAGDRLPSASWIKDLAYVAVKEWQVEFTGLLKEPRSMAVSEIKDGFPVRQFEATVLHHGDKIMGGEFRGTGITDLLDSLGVQDNATKVHFHAADTSEKITLSLSDIRNNSQSANPIILAWEMDGNSIPLSSGGPVKLVPPDDNVGDIGDFPSHYWWKWIVKIEVG